MKCTFNFNHGDSYEIWYSSCREKYMEINYTYKTYHMSIAIEFLVTNIKKTKIKSILDTLCLESENKQLNNIQIHLPSSNLKKVLWYSVKLWKSHCLKSRFLIFIILHFTKNSSILLFCSIKFKKIKAHHCKINVILDLTKTIPVLWLYLTTNFK